MTRISRHVLSEFLKPLTAGFGALLVLVLASELMEKLDKFIAGKAGIGAVAQYLAALLPIRAMELLPMAGLLAALFALGNLSRRRELTAALAGGLRPWVLVRPMVYTGILLSLFSWAVGEAVVPRASRVARRIWNEDIRHYMSWRAPRHADLVVGGRDGVFYSAKLLDLGEGRMEDVVIDQRQAERPATQWQARIALWRDGRWVLENGVERFFDESGLSLARQAPFAEKATPLRDKPEDLAPQDPDPESLSSAELWDQIRRLERLGLPSRRQRVELHLKFSFPWANLIVLLAGIPFAFHRTGGKVKAVGFALGAAFFYFGLMQVGRALGQKPWCPPLAGAWLANLAFLAFGAAGLYRIGHK